MKIYIGADHAGFELKNRLAVWLKEVEGYDVVDMGAKEFNADDDYPDFVEPVAQAVANERESRGIILGGSGQGEAIDANRFAGVRAGEFYGGDVNMVKLAREHNDINILSLGARFIDEELAKRAVKIFLQTPFSGAERHVRRIEKIDDQI